LGLLGYAGIVGLGLGLDYSYRKANDWKQLPQSDTTATTSTTTTSAGRSNEVESPQEVPPSRVETSISLRETLDTTRMKVGEMIQLLREGKKQAEPYLQQALEVAGNVKEEVGKQGGHLLELTEQILLDEKDQEQFQERWKNMTESIKDLSPDDATVRRISQDMEDALRQAKSRLYEDDVQEMRRDLQNAVDHARKRIAEERKNAKVDEKMEQVINDVRYKLFKWWRGD
jgi:hypothetical protein